jgi:hypothetical protein
VVKNRHNRRYLLPNCYQLYTSGPRADRGGSALSLARQNLRTRMTPRRLQEAQQLSAGTLLRGFQASAGPLPCDHSPVAKVLLAPTFFLSELSELTAEFDTNVVCHPSRVAVGWTVNVVHEQHRRAELESVLPILRSSLYSVLTPPHGATVKQKGLIRGRPRHPRTGTKGNRIRKAHAILGN